MNDLLMLRGELQSRKASGPGSPTLPAGVIVSCQHLDDLASDLERVLSAWQDRSLIKDVLVSVVYRRVVAKSNRVRALLSEKGVSAESCIRGARYEGLDGPTPYHVMTYYVTRQALNSSIDMLREASRVLAEHFLDAIDKVAIDGLWDKGKTEQGWLKLTGSSLSRNRFGQVVRDASFVTGFRDPAPEARDDASLLVTLYQTEDTVQKLLDRLGITVPAANALRNTVLLTSTEYALLCEKAPYLISMSCSDLSSMTLDDFAETDQEAGIVTIDGPSDEPVIGLIDMPFEQDHPPYFKDWVTYVPMLDEGIPIRPQDCDHGTSIASLLVDAPRINPDLEDGCGRFQVRHFGVASGERFSAFSVMKKIERIVEENPDIKVWNLSLGSEFETDQNAISPEAAILDEIQHRHDVLFVVAGTNDRKRTHKRIGAPADSINALVVNAVDRAGRPASYTRHGPVLGFYRKPDVAYFGGDGRDLITTVNRTGAAPYGGTSFAAPLVARKAAFLICKLGLSRDVAKALIIDAACGWNEPTNVADLGYGIVPQHIDAIAKCANDEIRFVISGMASEYETYNFKIPIPLVKGAHPYVARATLCYFPSCNRDQGVDYTDAELDLHFGRINKGNIVSLKPNHQGEPDDRTLEIEARRQLGKWDTVKHITDKVSARPRARKAYENPLWGFKVRKTSRFADGSHGLQPFSMVVTVKAIDGVNRQDAFVQRCFAEGWNVRRINVENQVSIYESQQVEVEFE